MKPNQHRPDAPTSRDLGLVNADAGKGDGIRNLSEQFRTNFDEVTFPPHADGFKVVGTKQIKKYK